MKLVTRFENPAAADEASRRLRAAGVMTRTAEHGSHLARLFKFRRRRTGVWVVFDDQFEDALRLLEDPDHVPRRVIGAAEIAALDAAAERHGWRRALKLFETASIYAFGAFLLGAMVYIVTGIFRDT